MGSDEIGSDRWPPALSSRSTSGLIAAFIVGSSHTEVANAVNVTMSNPNAIPELKTLSITIRYQAYDISSAPTDNNPTNGNNAEGSNVGLIVGLVVGIIGGLAVLAGVIFGLKAYQHKHERVRSQRDNMVNFHELLAVHNDHDQIIPTETKGKKVKILKNKSPTVLQLHPSHIQLHPPLAHVESDLPPGALCVTSLDDAIMHDIHHDENMMPEVER
ncbi:unnamed protein product [Rotaria sp. Silwood1]|nr:unnamed protein product [Rotaria sp. Silwood1]CAF5013065.1 unnamed protein product [Rotaria sp. Silwood1]